MKKFPFLIPVLLGLSVAARAQFTFTPQVEIGYGLMEMHKTNGVSLGLGVKTGYILKKSQHRITASGAYEYFFGRKDSTGDNRHPAMGYVPLKLHYAFPVLKGKRDDWYLEPNGGYAIMGTNAQQYKGFVGGLNFGTFDEDADMNIGFEVAKFNGLDGLYANITLRFGFLEMFSSHDTYSTRTERVIIQKAD